MAMLAVIDTNVLVSALLSKNQLSPVVKIYELIARDVVKPVLTKEILYEYKMVLYRPELRINKGKADEMINILLEKGKFITPRSTNINFLDIEDKKFYDAALSIDVPKVLLITGNIKHFPNDAFVMKPVDFVNLLGYN